MENADWAQQKDYYMQSTGPVELDIDLGHFTEKRLITN
jgi:hypothetical protein